MQDVDIKLIAKIKALLETRGCTEAEAQSRVAKAQELLEKHGLEMANLHKPTGARSDKKQVGGLYTWQRNLWDGVAKLNFCNYFFIRGLAKGSKYEHRLVGSHANVISTEVMASYLQGVIEDLAQKWAKEQGYGSVFVRDAIAYRDGMAARIVEKLAARRREIVSEARQAAERAKAERHQSAFADAQTGHALTILDVISSEEDFNNDYLNHWEMGTTARNRAADAARSVAWQAEYERKMRERDADELLHPWKKEARLKKAAEDMKRWQEEDVKAQAKRNRTPPKPQRERAQTAEEKRANSWAFYDGYRKGDTVGIDTQVDKTSRARIG